MNEARFSALTLAVIVLGISGIAAQTVLLREMLVLFGGNEFSLGVVIGSWVIAEALGAICGGRLDRLIRRKILAFAVLTALFSVAFPLAIHLTRVFKPLAGIPAEMGVGYGAILWGSFLLMLPAGFTHGFLFILACSLHASRTGGGEGSVGRVYVIDTLGIIIGGIATSYLFIPRCSSFSIAAGVAVINGAACAALACGATRRSRTGIILWSLACVCGAVLVAEGFPEQVDRWSVGQQWQGKTVVETRNSFYQNITVVKDQDQYTFFTDGRPLITTPVPDIAFVEEFVHLPMLAHPRPQQVLVISGGAGGVINEILKHPTVQQVDYVELDPALLTVLDRHPTALTLGELHDPRVKLHLQDGRSFLLRPPARYDVVFLGLPPPHSLQENRFFTTECFSRIKSALKPGGVFALASPGSLTYYSDELRNVNASLRGTLASVFPRTLTMPGETNLYLASESAPLGVVTPSLLGGRLEERRVATMLVNRQQLDYRFDPAPRQWFETTIPATGKTNRDFTPITLFHTIAYHHLQFSPWMHPLYSPISRYGFAICLAGVLLVLAVCVLLRRRPTGAVSAYAIATTGFTAMVVELVLFNSLQVFYGQVYHLAGMLITAFMAGIAAGSHIALRRLERSPEPRRLLALQEGGMVLLTLALAGVHLALEIAPVSAPAAVYGLFLPLLFLSGLLPGMEFPVANALVRLEKEGSAYSSGTAGLVYGADLLGGWLGGLAAGFLLLPVLGLYRALLILGLLKLGSLVLVAGPRGSSPGIPFDFRESKNL